MKACLFHSCQTSQKTRNIEAEIVRDRIHQAEEEEKNEKKAKKLTIKSKRTEITEDEEDEDIGDLFNTIKDVVKGRIYWANRQKWVLRFTVLTRVRAARHPLQFQGCLQLLCVQQVNMHMFRLVMAW